jgi:hypothetical protein
MFCDCSTMGLRRPMKSAKRYIDLKPNPPARVEARIGGPVVGADGHEPAVSRSQAKRPPNSRLDASSKLAQCLAPIKARL